MPRTNDESHKVMWYVCTSIAALLMSGNAFFVKRLVDQLDGSRDDVRRIEQRLVVVDYRLDELKRAIERRRASLDFNERAKYEASLPAVPVSLGVVRAVCPGATVGRRCIRL